MAKIELHGKAKIRHKVAKVPKKDPILEEYGERSAPFTIKMGSFILLASLFIMLIAGLFSRLLR